MRFDEILSHASEKKKKKNNAQVFQISQFYYSFLSVIMAVKGLNARCVVVGRRDEAA